MQTQSPDVVYIRESDLPLLQQRRERSYYAIVWAGAADTDGRLIERLIDIAFGAFGAEHLDVRVHSTER